MHRDSRGYELKPGQRVAYNRSGDVIEGTILDVSCASHIKVEPHRDFRRNYASTFSKVRHGRSVMILENV